MAVTEETRTHLIGLSVAMLGTAPGANNLSTWVQAMNDQNLGIEIIADRIAASSEFQSIYPAFLTNEEFGKRFLDNNLGDSVPAAVMAELVATVTGLLNGGMSRAELAHAAVVAMLDIAKQGASHPAYAALGSAAKAFHNKVEVAEYYTIDLEQADPSSRVLQGVTAEVGLDEIKASIDDRLDPPEPIYLTNLRDDLEGSDRNDRFIAGPDNTGGATFDARIDIIDGGAGFDSLEISDLGDEFRIETVEGAGLTSVERIYISTRGSIDVDVTDWNDVQVLDLGGFGSTDNVTVTVDGAEVSSARAFGGGVTITGAGGALDIEAGKTSAVKINSGEHTESVAVKGGASVMVAKNAAGAQSTSVTSVSVDGVGADIRSNVIESVHVHNTGAGVHVEGDSKAPRDLSVVLNKYGTKDTDGELQLDNITNIAISVAGDSWLDLTAEKAKMLSISGEGKLYGQLTTSELESLALVGSGDVDTDISGLAKLKSVDASGSTGNNKLGGGTGAALESIIGGSGNDSVIVSGVSGKLASISAGAGNDSVTVEQIGAKLETINTGAGNDTIDLKAGTVGADGIGISAGSGDDTVILGNVSGLKKGSTLSGGAGDDTLRLTDGEDSKITGVFSGFETLDVSGGSGTYDMSSLGISHVTVEENTSGRITLGKAAAGTTLSVTGTSGATTRANVVLQYATEQIDAASLFSGNVASTGASVVIYVDLNAVGKNDTKAGLAGQTHAALELFNLDGNLRGVSVDSSAVASTLKDEKVKVESKDYTNEITFSGSNSVEALQLTGNAQAVVLGGASGSTSLSGLVYVDARTNTAGVEVALSNDHAKKVTMHGSSGDDYLVGGGDSDVLKGNAGNDRLIGGAGEDTLEGGAGGDFLRGGDGSDKFIFHSASDSQLLGGADNKAYHGYDTIYVFNRAEDKILLSEELYESLKGSTLNHIKPEGASSAPAATAPFRSADGTFDSVLKEVIGDGKKIFKTEADIPPGQGFGVGGSKEVTTHAMAQINIALSEAGADPQHRATFIFIDVDQDGEFVQANDMVIKIVDNDIPANSNTDGSESSDDIHGDAWAWGLFDYGFFTAITPDTLG